MRKLILLLILGTAVASAWSWTRTANPVELSQDGLLADRLWLDRIPRNEKDTINAFAMFSEQAIGVFHALSQWRGAYEGFRYEAHGSELRIVYPQTSDRERVRAKARRCSDGGMDFCLELDGASRGVKRYYSREGWELGAASDLDAVKARIDRLRAQAEASE